MHEPTLKEAKEITTNLHQIALLFRGVKDTEGNIKEIGLVAQLTELADRLSPTSINFVDQQQKREVLKSLKQIDELLQKQQRDIVDTIDLLIASAKEHTEKLKQDRSLYDEKLKKELSEYLPKQLNAAYEKLDEKIRVTNLELTNFIDALHRRDFYHLALYLGGLLTGIVFASVL